MSKETFSKKLIKSMNSKLMSIRHFDLQNLLSGDEYFNIALCLAYMTLSKEKIIEKDIKNQDRLARLDSKVDLSEINNLFNFNFSSNMPKVNFSLENDNLWILDNIRDSIMHGAFDIDEDKKCFLIKNNKLDRNLDMEIPFSWFISYAKNDILSKKKLDKYTVKGFYYNKYKKDKKYFETDKELLNNILYVVNIDGNKFNVSDIEKRVRELFNKYSKDEISEEKENEYKDELLKNSKRYNKDYLISFYEASKKVKTDIEKEFPGVNVQISIDSRKHKFINSISKKLERHYSNYDLMFEMFNTYTKFRGDNLLSYISNMIESIDTNTSFDSFLSEHNINDLNKILNDTDIDYDELNELKLLVRKNFETLKMIILSVYGLSTLVINYENLYNKNFESSKAQNYGIEAFSKSKYLEYALKKKSIIMDILETEISIFSKNEQLNNCKDISVKQKIQTIINDLNNKKKLYEAELNNLKDKYNFSPFIKEDKVDHNKISKLENLINKQSNNFNNAKTKEDKAKIKKIISSLLDSMINEESKFTYGICYSMGDALTIIRNCFAHIGRISLGIDNAGELIVYFNDYDNNKEKSGEAKCKYSTLIKLLTEPFSFEEKEKSK